MALAFNMLRYILDLTYADCKSLDFAIGTRFFYLIYLLSSQTLFSFTRFDCTRFKSCLCAS